MSPVMCNRSCTLPNQRGHNNPYTNQHTTYILDTCKGHIERLRCDYTTDTMPGGIVNSCRNPYILKCPLWSNNNAIWEFPP